MGKGRGREEGSDCVRDSLPVTSGFLITPFIQTGNIWCLFLEFTIPDLPVTSVLFMCIQLEWDVHMCDLNSHTHSSASSAKCWDRLVGVGEARLGYMYMQTCLMN